MRVKVNYPNMPRGAVVFNEGLGFLRNGEETEIPEEQRGLVESVVGLQMNAADADLMDQDVLVLGNPDAELQDMADPTDQPEQSTEHFELPEDVGQPPVEQGSEVAK
jgi:hypothetical protein